MLDIATARELLGEEFASLSDDNISHLVELIALVSGYVIDDEIAIDSDQ